MYPPLKPFALPVFLAACAFAQPGFQPAVPENAPQVLETVQEEKAPAWSQFPRYLVEDQKAIWSAPFRVNREDARWYAVFGGAAAGLVATDRWTSTALPNTAGQMNAAKWTSRLGAMYTLAPAGAGIWAIGAITKNERMKKTGYVGLEALANATILSTAMKTFTQRQRPLEGTGGGTFFKGDGRMWNSGSSFPSGHAMTTWAMASAIAHQHPDSKAIPAVAYGLAGTVSISRLAARKHFASDIVIGSAIGWFIGRYVSRRHDPARRPSRLDRVFSFVHIGPAR